MQAQPNTYNLKPGTELIFTRTGKKLRLEKVTDKNVSWYVGFEYKGGCGRNILKMATQTLKTTNQGIADGTYLIVND